MSENETEERCWHCDGQGEVYVEEKREDEDGNEYTVSVLVTCCLCGGDGFVMVPA